MQLKLPKPMEPMLPKWWQFMQTVGILLWLACFLNFWVWWLRPEHWSSPFSFVIVSLVLVWITAVPAYFLFILHRARRPALALEVPSKIRAAMVVTKAPSEPFPVLEKTLLAMLVQDVPHDTWLADEKPDAATIAWCEAHGVRLSTRFGVEDYHRATWPRRTRCKEGNLAYFYDHYGYDLYDVVVQLDADHVPEPGYLARMLQPFADPEVGYVSAPSICDANASESWAARGRLYSEANLHGPLQAGYNEGWAPLCMGSHYAVRTSALRAIGGLGPELAEDHSTTLMMNAAGWKGVHAVDAIAHGLGPQTFADLAVQEFQWSRSLVAIFLSYTPSVLGKLSPRLRFQFIFSQLWYPCFATVMSLSFVMPLLALGFGFTFVNVPYVEFLLYFLPLGTILMSLAYARQLAGILRPINPQLFCWETATFAMARWPWAFLGTVCAVLDVVLKRQTEFRVTPKGKGGTLPARVLAPYAALSAISGVCAYLIDTSSDAGGYYVFALVNAVIYALVFAVILVAHLVENPKPRPVLRWAGALALASGVSVVPVVAAGPHWLVGLESLSWNNDYLRLTESTFTLSGAGIDASKTRKIELQFKWLK